MMRIASACYRLVAAAVLLTACSSSLAAADPGPGAAGIDFLRQVRPILVDKCFACHGSDAEHRKGELRLDLRDSAIAGGESGLAAITPGKPDESELIRRIDVRGGRANAPRHRQKTPDRPGAADAAAVDRRRGRISNALGIHGAGSTRGAGKRRAAVAAQRFGQVCAGSSEGRRAGPVARGRPGEDCCGGCRST